MTTTSPGATGRRVLVVDDEPLMSLLLANALTAAGFQTCTSASVVDARAAIAQFDPDAAVIDVSLGRGPTGIDLAHMLQRSYPGIAVLLLTKHSDLRAAGHGKEDIPPGVGLMRKEAVSDIDALVNALEALLREQSTPTADVSTGPLAQLTSRQIEVLRMVAQGYTSQEIARQRGSTRAAVEKMLTSIYTTLRIEPHSDISQRSEAMRIFIAYAGIPERP